jgi:hypothetical protein
VAPLRRSVMRIQTFEGSRAHSRALLSLEPDQVPEDYQEVPRNRVYVLIALIYQVHESGTIREMRVQM